MLRARYPNEPARVLADALGRALHAIYARAHRLGLEKSAKFHESDMSGRIQRGMVDPRMKATQFKKGGVPKNKGLRRPGWSKGRMRDTQFKKGRPASEARNYCPIGTEKIDRKRNALMRKITDDASLAPVMRWKPVHVLVWQQHNGPVPAGHIVIFKPGRKTLITAEITVDRLELVSLAENMRRNTIHNLPTELAGVIRLRGAVVRQINKREKKDGND